MGSSRCFSISTPEHRSFFFADPSTSFTRKSIPNLQMHRLRPIPSASAAADQTAIAPSHASSSPPSSSSSPDHRTRSPSPPRSGADGAEVLRETSGSIPIGGSTRDETWHQYKGSPQLSRWALSRRNGSGRRSNGKSPSPSPSPSPSALTSPMSHHDHDVYTLSMDAKPNNDNEAAVVDDDDKKGFSSHGRRESVIYMVSDGTGWTAEHCVNAALGQFEHCLVDQGCPVNTHLFSQVVDVERLIEIVRDAGRENATLIYTLADPALAETAKNACEMYGIAYLDLLGPITQLLGGHLGVAPLGLPRGAPGRTMTLSREYFRRIEAVEFTIKQDDGALPQNLQKADLILVGVSRTSKTPLSTYMAQKGYKVANVPLVLGIEPPKELFEVDQNKIYALTISPTYLHSIRTARSKTLGLSAPISYSEMEHVKKELEFSSKLFMENPKWPVIEVTGKAIEETAAVILRIYHDRQGKHVMPRISHRY